MHSPPKGIITSTDMATTSDLPNPTVPTSDRMAGHSLIMRAPLPIACLLPVVTWEIKLRTLWLSLKSRVHRGVAGCSGEYKGSERSLTDGNRSRGERSARLCHAGWRMSRDVWVAKTHTQTFFSHLLRYFKYLSIFISIFYLKSVTVTTATQTLACLLDCEQRLMYQDM